MSTQTLTNPSQYSEYSRSTQYSETPLSRLVVGWVMLIPLLYIAGNGGFWFIGGEDNSRLGAVYGGLVSDPRRTLQNAVLLVIMFGLLGVMVFPRFKAVMSLIPRQKVFVALAGWATLSILWSQFPSVSLLWAPVAAFNVIFAFYLYRRFSPEQQMQLLINLGWICIVLNIVLALFFPDYGLDYGAEKTGWRGMTSTKNLCSMLTIFLLPAVFYAPARSTFAKIARAAYILLSVLIIVMCQSATGAIGLVFLFAYVLAMKLISKLQYRDRKIALLTVATVSVVVVSAFVVAGQQILILLNRDPTLTGRTIIWQSVIPSIMRHPILGYGYQAFWRGYSGESANIAMTNRWAVSSAHNSYLQVALDLGFVGVGMVVFALFRAIRDGYFCLPAEKSPYLTWCGAIIVLTIVTTADEVALMVPNSPVWLLFMLVCIGLSEGARRIRLDANHG